MPIIKSKSKVEKEQVRINMDKSTVESIRAYCEWAKVGKVDEFFEEAVKFLFRKDKEWQKHLNQNSETA